MIGVVADLLGRDDRHHFKHLRPCKSCGDEGVDRSVRAGLGIGMVIDRMVGRELAAGLLVRTLPECSLVLSDVWVIFPEGRRVRQRARLFVDWLEGCLPQP